MLASSRVGICYDLRQFTRRMRDKASDAARDGTVGAEAARLQAKSEGSDRVRGALGCFTELWQSVPRKSRAGLMRLLVPPMVFEKGNGIGAMGDVGSCRR
jgi:hypothetical protein